MIPTVAARVSELEKHCVRYEVRRLNVFGLAVQNPFFRHHVEETRTQHYAA